MSVNIQLHGIKELGRLSSEFKKQLPYAAANGLNEIAFDVMRDVKSSALAQHVTLRNRFTQGQFQVDKATKKSLIVEVGFTDKAWYMEKLDEPTTRTPRVAKYLAIPTTIARRGNTIKGLVKAPMKLSVIKSHAGAAKGFVLPLKNGHLGIFARIGRKKVKPLTLLYTLVKQTNYKRPHFPFEKVIEHELKKYKFEDVLIKHLMRAVK